MSKEDRDNCSACRGQGNEEGQLEMLAKIRARRDNMDDLGNVDDFWGLFDDGAEFGPDKPEPEYVARHNPDRTVSMIIDGRDVAAQMSENCFNAIKKLGREEAGPTSETTDDTLTCAIIEIGSKMSPRALREVGEWAIAQAALGAKEAGE